MFEGRSVLCVIPARGGSKGIPLKNLRQVGQVSLVARAIQSARALDWIDTIVVSTDHAGIAEEARRYGVDVPFLRPEHLSGDRVGDWDVLSHALEASEDYYGKQYEVVLMLQPTSPLRRPEQVTAVASKLIGGGYDAVWTLTETNSKQHPLKQLTVDATGTMDYYDPRGAEIVARQELGKVYHRNGIAYGITRNCLRNLGNIKGNYTGAVVIEGPVINVDDESDLQEAQEYFSQSPA